MSPAAIAQMTPQNPFSCGQMTTGFAYCLCRAQSRPFLPLHPAEICEARAECLVANGQFGDDGQIVRMPEDIWTALIGMAQMNGHSTQMNLPSHI
ncbi:hypothetical protein GPALN_001884 [Globodera pallida]|nr:hypothetical protein GPALN_001884 [Globodera pallida]